jgi:hypothetical protein
MLRFAHENPGYGRSLSPDVPLLAHYPEGMNVGAAGNIVLAKHSTPFSLIDCIAVGVDRMQRNFDLMRRRVGT